MDQLSKEEKTIHDVQLEEAILKPMQLPNDPESLWFAYFAPTHDSVDKLIKRREIMMDDDYEDEEVSCFHFKLFLGI